jgi:hypothetical protein
MPVGPHILCPEKHKNHNLTPAYWVLNGEQLALHRSKQLLHRCVLDQSYLIGLIVPSAFEIWIVATILVFLKVTCRIRP